MQAIVTEPHHLQQVITREMTKQGYTITSLSKEMAVKWTCTLSFQPSSNNSRH